MTTVAELVAFLEAQIGEDERVAREAIEPDAMYPWGDRTLPRMSPDQIPDEVRGYLGGPWGEHFARHDPARVLAECEAKRELLRRIEQHAEMDDAVREYDFHEYDRVALFFLRALALAWKGADGFKEEWG